MKPMIPVKVKNGGVYIELVKIIIVIIDKKNITNKISMGAPTHIMADLNPAYNLTFILSLLFHKNLLLILSIL